jgi:hypothetical protein
MASKIDEIIVNDYYAEDSEGNSYIELTDILDKVGNSRLTNIVLNEDNDVLVLDFEGLLIEVCALRGIDEAYLEVDNVERKFTNDNHRST